MRFREWGWLLVAVPLTGNMKTLDRAAFLGVLALVLAAPFELRDPVSRAFGLNFTSVELVAMAALGAGAVWLAGGGTWRHLWTPLTLPAVLLAASLFISSLLAAADAGIGLRFSGRFVAGFLVFLLVCAVVTDRRRLELVVLAAAASAGAVSLLAVLEAQEIPWVLKSLEAFRPRPYFVGGELRASSTLAYPTITSMYLEIAYALTLGLFLARVEERRWLAAGFLFFLLGLMAQAVIFTLTRAGLVGLVLACAVSAMIWIRTKGSGRGLKALAASAACIALLVTILAARDAQYWLRLTTVSPADWYRVGYEVPERLEMEAGGRYSVAVTVTNRGRATWDPSGPYPFRLSYHWLDPDTGDAVLLEGARTELPFPVRPGESVTLTAPVEALPVPGRYLLAWDMLQEHRMWFSSLGVPNAHSDVEVRPPAELPPPVHPAFGPLPRRAATLERLHLWSLALQMTSERPWIGVGPDNFRLLYGPRAGLKVWDRSLHANNTYLEFATGAGIPAGMLFLWLVVRLLRRLRQKGSRLGSADRPYFAGISAAVAAILAHGLVDHFFPFTPTYLMIWTVFALACARVRNSDPWN